MHGGTHSHIHTLTILGRGPDPQCKALFLVSIRPKKKKCAFPVTRPTLIFPSDPKVFIGIPKKMKFYHTQPTLFAAICIGFATFAVIFEAVLLFKHLF